MLPTRTFPEHYPGSAQGSASVLCRGMATNLSIDFRLIELALELSGECTSRAAVIKALEELIVSGRQKRLLDLMGKLDWQPPYHHKAERSRK